MLSFKPYRRKLKVPIKMSRGVIEYREGIILRLESGGLCFSEVLILDYFATESLQKSMEILGSLPRNPSLDNLKLIPEECFATRFAFESLFLTPKVEREMKVSKLLPAGEAAVKDYKLGIEQGFETFKLKIGIYDRELEVLKKLLSIENKVKFRLDANAGLTLAEAIKWFDFCENKPIEFIEQPLAVNQLTQMQELTLNYSTPIALDESIARFEDIKIADSINWNGIYVVKPLRLGNLRDFLSWRENTDRKIVYSSALETVFGANIALRIAASDKKNNFSLGFGVCSFFEDDQLGLLELCKQRLILVNNNLEKTWQSLK